MISAREIFHTIRRHHSMHIAAGLSLITTIIIFGVAYREMRSYPDALSAKIVVDVERGIKTELDILSKKTTIAAQDQFFADAVYNRDTQKISSWIREKRDTLGVSRIAVVDTDGFVVSRTAFGYVAGDNLFLSHPFGRLIASGVDYASSVEIGMKDPREVFFISSAPISINGEKIGTLFLSNLADDVFVGRFVDSHIGHAARVAFYRDVYGIYGSNIESERSKELLNANIQATSDRLQALTHAAVFRTSDGKMYLTRDIPLQGVESQTSNLIVFIPILRFFVFVLVAALLPLIVFIVFCIILHHRSRREAMERLYYLAASMLGFTGMIITLLVCVYLFGQIPKLIDTQYPLYNSILSLRPETGVFDTNVGQKFSVVLDSGGEAINTVSIKLRYDPALVSIEAVDTAHSLCEYFLTDDYDKKGFIDLECIIPNPGFRGREATVADIYVKARHSGQASFTFTNDSQILANDGLGTDVLRQAIGGTFIFKDRDSTIASSTLSVFCGTHPNPERWYPSRVASLSWTPRIPVLIEIKKSGSSQTRQTFSLPPARITLPDDGEYVFTALPIDARVSKKSTVQVRVDSTPPEIVSLEASDTLVKVGSIVRFVASAEDSGSGLQRTSYMKINNDLFFPIGKEVHIPFPNVGTYEVTLRAYDNAGNFKDSSISIEVVK
jgi:hypothetical protein